MLATADNPKAVPLSLGIIEPTIVEFVPSNKQGNTIGMRRSRL